MKRIIFTSILVCIAFLILISCGKGSAYERGIITETGFESKYLNLKFDLPQGFVMASDEEMLEIMKIGNEALETSKLEVNFANLTTVYEMMASAPIGFPNVSLMVEKLIISGITTDKYSAALRKTLAGVSAVNYVIGDDITTVEIAGQSYKQLSASLPDFGIIQNYIFRKSGNRMISFITTYTPDTNQEMKMLMDGFSKLTN